MRVLVVKTSSMGDVIHTLPALTDASDAYPNISFDWVVEETFAEIPSWHPNVDRVIPVAMRRWRKDIVKTMMGKEWKVARSELAKRHYDFVIDAQGLLKSAWITRFARGASYGFDRESAREPLASFFYKNIIHVDKDKHAVERVRSLFAQALNYKCPDAAKGGEVRYGLDQRQFSHSDSGETFAVFLHGTTSHDKHWPEPYWLALAQQTVSKGIAVKLPWGNEVEYKRAQRIAAQVQGVAVLPKLNLKSLACVLNHAQVVVAVDTGLGHLAAAMAVPCLSLYGPTSPKLIGAYGKNQLHLSVASIISKTSINKTNTNKTNTDKTSVEKTKLGADKIIRPEIFTALTPEIVWSKLESFL